LGLVLANPDLRAAFVSDDPRGHGRRRGELSAAVAAHEEDIGLEGVALVAVDPVDEELLSLAHDVLLSSKADDRVVAHVRRREVIPPEKTRARPATAEF